MGTASRRRRIFACAAFAAWGAAFLSGVDVVPDDRKIEPLARATDEPAAMAAQRKITGAPARYAATVPVFIHLSDDDPDVPRRIMALGGRASAARPRLYAGAIPRDAARYVSNWPSVAYIESGKMARPLLDLSRPATGADVVQAGTGLPGSIPFDGTGSFVGIVDTGLYQGHLDFYDNGSLAKPRVAQWFPSQAAAGVDIWWHGTHVAGIAAGNGFSSGGLYTGMAPGARLLVRQSSFLTTDIPIEVNGILAAAGASPVAVNLSLGLIYGPHDGTSGFEASIDASAAGASRRIVAVAAGNERGDREHFQAVLPPFAVVNVPLTMAGTGVPQGTMVDIWADGADRYNVTASLPGGRASVASDQPPNGATHFQVFFTSSVTVVGTVRMERTRNAGSGKVDAYVDAQDGQLDPAVSVDIGTIFEPANGANVIAVGSFNTKAGGAGAVGDISTFSSMGPARDGRLKPDIAAPGSLIYSARSRDAFAGFPVPTVVPTNDNYVIMQGTSMAAPHVAGIGALVWQSNPSLTGAQMRARLKKTAVLPAGVPVPDITWGNGKVNALQAVSRTVAAITAPASAAPGATVNLSAGNSSGAFDPSVYSYSLSYSWTLAVKPPASSATLSSNAAATTLTPDVPGLYTVSLTVSQSTPAGVPAGTDNAVIRVNNPPTAVITGPGGTDNVVTAAFSGRSSSDPDGQPLQFHWVLVSRPAGSAATLAPIGAGDNATLFPDIKGNYEIGLRADDGLDNSALAVSSFWSGGVPAAPHGGGGGCAIAPAGTADPGAAIGTLLFLMVGLWAAIASRRPRTPI